MRTEPNTIGQTEKLLNLALVLNKKTYDTIFHYIVNTIYSAKLYRNKYRVL